MITDEAGIQQQQKLEKLYISTRAGKVAHSLLTVITFSMQYIPPREIRLVHCCTFLCIQYKNGQIHVSAFPKGYCTWSRRIHSDWHKASRNWSVCRLTLVFEFFWISD